MSATTILVIWGILEIIINCYCASYAAQYGMVKASENLGLMVILTFILIAIASFLLFESGYWWCPIVLHFFVVGPAVKAIYKI